MNAGTLVLSDGLMLAIVAVAFLTVTCVAVAVVAAGAASRRRVRQRIEHVKLRFADAPVAAMASLRRDSGQGRIAGLDWLVKRFLPHPAVLRARLAKTGYNMSPAQYVLLCLGVGAAIILAVVFALRQPVAIGLAAGVVAGVGLPHLAIGWLGARRVGKFLDLFPEAIDLIVRGLKSGLPVTESMAAVGREVADPVGGEFRHIADAVRLGQDLESALWDAGARVDTADFKFFIICLSVQKETGGNLSETLENLSDILRRRRQMKLKIKAMSSEARASAYIIGSLPLIMLGVLYMMNPEYIATLFTDLRGRMMLGIGVGVQLVGVAVMAKMVRFEI